jgi:hypothetical protein
MDTIRAVLEDLGLVWTDTDRGLSVPFDGYEARVWRDGDQDGTWVAVYTDPFPIDTLDLLVLVNGAGRRLLAPAAHVIDRRVRYGAEFWPDGWPDWLLRERFARLLNGVRLHHTLLHARILEPDRTGAPVRPITTVSVLSCCPNGHRDMLPAVELTVEPRQDGSADATWECPRCRGTVRRTVSRAVAVALRRRGATDRLGTDELRRFRTRLASTPTPTAWLP